MDTMYTSLATDGRRGRRKEALTSDEDGNKDGRVERPKDGQKAKEDATN